MSVFQNYYTPACVEWSEVMWIINNTAERKLARFALSFSLPLCLLHKTASGIVVFSETKVRRGRGREGWSQIERTLSKAKAG